MAIRGGFEIATAYVDLILDKDHAKQGVRELPRDLTPHADKAGRDTGNVISRGIRLSIVRNSPLIAAAIAGGIAAGAPLLLGAATVLMGGVAAVAAAQSSKVKSAWVGTWEEIKRGAIEDARILEPTFVRMAGTIAAAFQEMRPAMREAFADLGPQLDTLTGGVTSFAQSFTGGLMVAIRNGGPVIEGLSKALVSIGDGFEDAMTRMAAHSESAGQVWAQLGDILGTLLSLFGELMGTGVEIANIMLPALGGSLKAILAVAEVLEPILPALVTGFSAFKIAQTASRWLDTFALSLGKVAKGSGAMSTAAGKGSTVIAGMSKGTALLAGVMAAFAVTTAQNEGRIKDWTQTLIRGGAEADALRDRAARARDKMMDLTSGEWWKSTISLGTLWNDNDMHNVVDEFDDAKKAAQEYLNSLTPMAAAQQAVTWAQEDLNNAIAEHGPGSREAATATAALDKASAEVTRQLALEELALDGVTQAMIDMASQEAARANSSIGYRQSVIDTRTALEELKTAQNDSKTTADELATKQLAVESAYIAQAEAAGKLAFDALPAVMDEQERNALSAQASLRELDKLKEMYGGTLPENLEQYRQGLINVVGQMDITKIELDAMATGLEQVGVKVTELPDTKMIRIEAPTQEIVDKLAELGFTITEIPGSKDVLVSADTEEAKLNLGNLAALLSGVDGTTARPTVEPQDHATGLLDEIWGDLFNLDGTVVQPDATLNTTIPGQAQGDIDWLLGLDGQHAEPTATLNTTVPTQTDADLDDLLGLGGTHAEPTATLNTTVPDQAQGDIDWLVGLGGTTATPQATLSTTVTPQVASDLARLFVLHSQRPTPVAGLTNNPLVASQQQSMGLLGALNGQRPTPVAGLQDNASGGLAFIKRAIDALYNKTVYVTTVHQDIGATGRGTAGLAGGGKIGQRGPIYAATGTKVRGPGGPIDDLVRAVGPNGSDYRLSAGEWIVNALASSKYGDEAMRALNAGTALVTLPEDRPRSHGATWMGDGAPAGVSVTPTANGATVTVGQLHVHIQGVFDLTKPMEMRRLGQRLREVLIQLDREHA